MTRVAFTVYGRPMPKGSKRTVPRKGGNPGSSVVIDANPNSTAHLNEVAAAAFKAAPPELLEGPLGMAVTFYRSRPQGHYGTGRNSQRVKPSAPTHPTTAPDLDKTTRLVLDALTSTVYRDDSQVVQRMDEKRWGDPERTEIVVWTVDP